MSFDPAQSLDRLDELLADRATQGLDALETLELDRLLEAHPSADAASMELAAAALDLALMPADAGPLPAEMRELVAADAARFFALPGDYRGARVASMPEPVTTPSGLGAWGWYAAAAAVIVAVWGWLPAARPSGPTIEKQYAAFVEDNADIIRVPWKGQEPGYEQVGGQALWSTARQEGYMRLVDLPPNDPQKKQYQLWIVDPARDANPIDGGVFDVTTAGEVLIPMDAKLQVGSPAAFAITLEQPGGVVVSGGPLLVVGAVSG